VCTCVRKTKWAKLLKSRTKDGLRMALWRHVRYHHEDWEVREAITKMGGLPNDTSMNRNWYDPKAEVCKVCGKKSSYIFVDFGLCKGCYRRWEGLWEISITSL